MFSQFHLSPPYCSAFQRIAGANSETLPEGHFSLARAWHRQKGARFCELWDVDTSEAPATGDIHACCRAPALWPTPEEPAILRSSWECLMISTRVLVLK